MFSKVAQFKSKESVSILKYDFQSKKYVFQRDKFSSLNEMLKTDYTNAYFIKNFPMIVGQSQKQEEILQNMYFIKNRQS